MRSFRVQHLIAIGGVVALTLIGALAAVTSRTDLALAATVILLGASAILILDVRRRIGVQAEVTRQSYRTVRNAAANIQFIASSTGATMERVERGERRMLASVESANLRARDWNMDHAEELYERFDKLRDAMEARHPTSATTKDDGPELASHPTLHFTDQGGDAVD